MTFRPLITVSALALTACFATMAPAQNAAPEITGIELGQAGVALFTMVGQATGPSLSFTVPQEAASDIMASLIVRDPSGAVIDLQTDTPGSTAAALHGSPFEGGLPLDLPSLLGKLVGEQVTLMHAGGAVEGVLVGVRPAGPTGANEKTQYPIALVLQQSRLAQVVLSPGVQVDLAPGRSSELFEDLAKALTFKTAQQQAGRDMRRFDLTLQGTDTRDVALSYVTEAPAWKNSYRLLLGEGRLQGWAAVENLSGHDWDDIALTLTTGSPVAYRSHLIAPRLIARPDLGDQFSHGVAESTHSTRKQGHGGGALLSMMSSTHGADTLGQHLDTLSSGAGQAFEAGQSNGILRYDMPDGIDLAAGRTANVMYLDASVGPQIHALYRPLQDSQSVLLAVGFQSEQALAPGIISVQDEGGFVGDAPFLGAIAGQDTLLPVAVANGADIVQETHVETRLQDLTVIGGKLFVSALGQRTTTYSTPLPDHVSHLTVQHPIGNTELHSTNGEVVRKMHTYEVTVPAQDGTGFVKVVEGATANRELDLSLSALGRLISDMRGEDVIVPAHLAKTIDQVRTLLTRNKALDDQRAELETRYDALVAEQARLRENLEIVTQDTLRNRYTQAMSVTETHIVGIFDQREALQQAQTALDGEIQALFESL